VTDVLLVTVDTTTGWRAAVRELRAALERCGADVESVGTGRIPEVRTFMLTDYTQAQAASRAARDGIDQYHPKAIIYCSLTAALLWPRAGAIWLDAVAAENRPGRHGIWQRIVERRRLQQSPLIIKMSEHALEPLRDIASAVVVPTPVDSSGPPPPQRDIAAVTYVGDPAKRRLDRVLEAWANARRGDERLVVAGHDGAPGGEGVEVAGRLAPDEYRSLLRRARVFVAAPIREDYGIAPLEALADGCMLVTTPARGAYPAFDLAQKLDPRLTTDDLTTAVRAALDDPLPDYTTRAAELLQPYTREAVDHVIARDVLPRLLP
jgi:hypothetical protein